tara:strand:+ start:3587 stop:4795 length:1209 start_codon:yes stop_codon:yes gene_type:complete
MSLLTENNRQYYEGAQGFRGDGNTTKFTTTFNTNLVFGSAIPSDINYQKNNFKLYTSVSGIPGSWSEVVSDYSVTGNVITFLNAPSNNLYIVVQLKKLNGGNYGTTLNDKAYGTTVEKNYGSYSYTKLSDVINNFLIAYVGPGKLIQDVKRTDVIFHAKRAMQEFSYDTLRSINSQELNVPHNLSVVMPQDYVNYVNMYWVDDQGVKHIIMPSNNLTKDPYSLPLQDNFGVPTQDNFDNNIEGTSITEDRWKNNFLKDKENLIDDTIAGWEYYYGWPEFGYGQLYGIDPQYANSNGYFTINDREGKISFSANLVDRLIILEYISDGLSTDVNTRVPKLAEEAMYAYITHAVIASRINQPEYLVQRLKREASAKLRNAKIRLSNVKTNEIVQVMRGKSKWLKH